MAIVSMQLDPNAAAYSDDEIVTKINNAATAINRADSIDGAALSAVDSDAITEGSTNVYDTGEPVPALTDDEVVTAINNASTSITREAALSQDDLNLVKTNPAAGEFSIKNIHRDVTGKVDVEYDDVAV
jgi:hypothetical protein